MVDAAPILRLASFMSTAATAVGENSKPPYTFGMIIAKKPCSLINAQTSTGKSTSLWDISQSSSMRHNSSVGPSRNACSSSVYRGAGKVVSLLQSGRPLNNSPSHQTVPASSASLSVSEIDGKIDRYIFSSGEVIRFRRKAGIFNAIRPANAIHSRNFHHQ